MRKYILVASCPEKMGIVRAVSEFIFSIGASIIDAAQFSDLEKQRFFTRWEFVSDDQALPSLDDLKQRFAPVATEFSMDWEIHDADVKPRILIAVSKFGHCLNDLLYRWTEEDFPAQIVGVVSNHEDFRRKVEWYELPYFFLPTDAHNRAEQENKLRTIIDDQRIDLLVLARYMQILSDDLCQHVNGRAINIHHSFLPSFKGARPYHQAFDRGVKIMGATAHYVTPELDEGPIIEQDVQRVEHSHDSAAMVRQGKSIESVVLARAVIWHCQHRVLRNGRKTVIFK